MNLWQCIAAAGALLSLSPFATAQDRTTTLTIVNASNTELKVENSWAESGKFMSPVPPAIGAMNQIQIKTVNTVVLTGCSGTIGFAPEHGSGFIVIQWDNPYIGSNSYNLSAPAGWDVFAIKGNNGDDGSGNDAYLTIRIEGHVNVVSKGPNVNLASSGPGIVKGRVLWPASYGSPSLNTNQQPGAKTQTFLQLGSGPERFFQFAVTQPTLFQPYASATSLTSVYYQGTRGEYIQPKNTGKIVFSNLTTPAPGFYGFEFTISNLPVGVPISIAVGPGPNVSWQPPRPNGVVVATTGGLQPSFYCVAADDEADLTPKMSNISGFDFTVATEWMPSGSLLHTYVRPTAGASKATARFGTIEASALSVISAALATKPHPVTLQRTVIKRK